MTTETIFVRKPCNLQDVLRGTAEIRAIRAMRGDSGTPDDDRCTVAAGKHLTAAEWADFTGDFSRDRDWLANFADVAALRAVRAAKEALVRAATELPAR